MKNTPNPPTKITRFIYDPKNKGESSNKGDADLNSISDHPNRLSIVKEPSATNKILEFLPKGFIITKKGKTLKITSALLMNQVPQMALLRSIFTFMPS